MNRKRRHLTVITLMMLVLMFSMLTVPVSANGPSTNPSQLLSQFQLEMNKTSLAATINTNWGESIKISKPKISPMSNFNLDGNILSYSDSLTTADPSDWYFFSVPDTRNIIFQLQSSNTNYRVDSLSSRAWLYNWKCTCEGE